LFDKKTLKRHILHSALCIVLEVTNTVNNLLKKKYILPSKFIYTLYSDPKQAYTSFAKLIKTIDFLQ